MSRPSKESGAAWLGPVPEEWAVVPAKSLFAQRAEASRPDDVHLTPSQKYGVLPQTEYMAITGGRVVLNLAGSDNMKHVEPGDVISHLRSFQGGLETSDVSGKVSTAYTVLRPRAGADRGFFRYLFKSERYIQALGATTNQLRDGQSIRYAEFSLIPLPLPPLTEQRAIADYLNRETAKIDTLIEKQATMIERLRERRVGLVVATVTRGLNADAAKQAGPGWAGEVPASWRVLPLKRVLASVQTGTWGTEADGGGDDITCVRVADFDRPRLAVGESDTLRSVSASDRRRLGLRRGDLLIEKSGGTAINPVGFVAIYDTDQAAVCANFIGRMRFRPGHASRFWLYALPGSYASGLTWRHVKQTTGIQNLDLDSFVAEQFPVPPLDEQREIADYLDRETAKIDTLIAKVERHIELAKERRAALITAAVTGQIDVMKDAA